MKMSGKRIAVNGFQVVALLLLAASCTSHKKVVTPNAHAHYEWMTAKINGELEVGKEEISFSGTIRMKRDSAVWVSASAFMGVENLRALITQDSVWMLNRVDQTYLAEPLEAVHAPSLQELQSRLVGDGSADHVELPFGQYTAKIRYTDRQWDVPTTFPIKINKSYERIRP